MLVYSEIAEWRYFLMRTRDLNKYQQRPMDPRDFVVSRPVDHCDAHRDGRQVLLTGDGRWSMLTALATPQSSPCRCCQQQTDDGSFFKSLGDGERALVTFFSKSRVWGKIPEGSTLIFEYARISLKYSVA